MNNNLYISGYKCFSQNCGFSNIQTSNLLIGKNNIGKSSLLDMFQIANGSIKFNMNPQISFQHMGIGKELISSMNHSDIAEGQEDMLNHMVTLMFSQNMLASTQSNFDNVSFLSLNNSHYIPVIENKEYSKLMDIKLPYHDKTCYRISADRDIKPEQNFFERFDPSQVKSNGDGLTCLLNSFINGASNNYQLINNTFISAFNDIMKSDMVLKSISIKKDKLDLWEIYLESQDGNIFSLSNSGSGLKTIIFTLCVLIVFPEIYNTPPNNCIFIFEELENNLHPAIQRRLFSYIHRFATENKSIVFYSTHSNIPIDIFFNRPDASITLLRKVEGVLETIPAFGTNDLSTILDELEIKASDLLQSNTIIWVEGPSDRIYINKWLKLVSNDELDENIHYQFAYYGGRLLSHYSSDYNHTISNQDLKSNEENDFISMLKVNRKSIIVIDSDIKKESDSINNTKMRIEKEFMQSNSICWITDGREIENYLPLDLFDRLYSLKEPDISDIENSDFKGFCKYSDIKDLLNNSLNFQFNKIPTNEGNRFESNKVKFAKKYSEHYSLDYLNEDTSLKVQIEDIVNFIKKANYL